LLPLVEQSWPRRRLSQSRLRWRVLEHTSTAQATGGPNILSTRKGRKTATRPYCGRAQLCSCQWLTTDRRAPGLVLSCPCAAELAGRQQGLSLLTAWSPASQARQDAPQRGYLPSRRYGAGLGGGSCSRAGGGGACTHPRSTSLRATAGVQELQPSEQCGAKKPLQADLKLHLHVSPTAGMVSVGSLFCAKEETALEATRVCAPTWRQAMRYAHWSIYAKLLTSSSLPLQ